ncbi:MAG: DcaP family trimeric outer membrane transporter, partial [Gammaproteobacteria bacterium]|nr:DcaP family trimeric outer membrane transporter [Gammaproteobacteria bacterium]
MNGMGKSRDVRSAIASSALMLVALGAPGVLQAAEGAGDADRISALEAQLNQQKAAMQQQQKMIEAMDAELKRLKASEDAAATSTAVIATGQAPASAPAARASSPSKLSVDVYGFAQTDAIYDFKRVDPNWEDTLRVTTIPVQSGLYGNDGNFTFSVRQSRLGIKGAYGDDITFKLEGELFGVGSDQGQTTLRVRHAYGTYKNFLMGQTWSNFMDIDIFPNTVDYWGPTGMVFYRNQQATYTFPMGEDLVSVGLEDPGTALTVGRFRDTSDCDLPNAPLDCDSTGSTAADVFQSYNDLPDLAARYRNNGDFGHYQVAGIVRKLGYERLDNGAKDYEVGWGINTSSALNTWGKDQLKLQVAYGEGIGNYMNDGGIDIAPDSTDITKANAETVPLWGLSAYYDHYWSDKWSTSVGWSMTDLDTTDGQGPDEFKKGQIANINLLYYPADHVLMG